VDTVPRGDTRGTVAAVAAALAASPNAVAVLTGGSELVAGTRHALRDVGVRSIKTKTYWIPGRTGLD
jgi:hypothetical protein